MTHRHDWTRLDTHPDRYVCHCGVVGHRTYKGTIEAFRCQKELGRSRKHCGAEAVHVTGQRREARCAEHMTAIEVTDLTTN